MGKARIDPTKNENLEDMNLLLQEADRNQQQKLRRSIAKEDKSERDPYLIDGSEVDVAHSLLKFGDRWWVVDEKLGEGSDSKVKLMGIYFEMNADGNYVQHQATNACVAKVLNPRGRDWALFKEFAEHEVKMLREIHGESAEIDLVIDEDKQKIYILSPHVPGDTLGTFLTNNPALPFEERVKLAAAIKDAVADLHKKGFVHRDLKPENIMVNKSEDGRYQVTLIDFAAAYKKGIKVKHNVGVTTYWFAPAGRTESDKPSDKSTTQVDLYSLAGVMGSVFSDWTNKQHWTQLELFAKKIEKVTAMYNNSGGFLSPIPHAYAKPSEWDFNFDALKNGNTRMDALVATLKQLAEAKRDYSLDSFPNEVLSVSQNKPVMPDIIKSREEKLISALRDFSSNNATYAEAITDVVANIEALAVNERLKSNPTALLKEVKKALEYLKDITGLKTILTDYTNPLLLAKSSTMYGGSSKKPASIEPAVKPPKAGQH